MLFPFRRGTGTRSHADVTDRDRDESSKRRRSAWVRANPQIRHPDVEWDYVPRLFSAEAGGPMRVQDVMSEGVKTVSPTTAAEDAWNMMRLNRIHHLVVTKRTASLARSNP